MTNFKIVFYGMPPLTMAMAALYQIYLAVTASDLQGAVTGWMLACLGLHLAGKWSREFVAEMGWTNADAPARR